MSSIFDSSLFAILGGVVHRGGHCFFLSKQVDIKYRFLTFFWFKFWQLLKSPCRRDFTWPSNYRVTWFAIIPLHYTIWERMRMTMAFILVHIWSINAQVQRNHIWKRPRNLTNRISDLTLISQKFKGYRWESNMLFHEGKITFKYVSSSLKGVTGYVR